MSGSGRKLLFLKLPHADDAFAQALVQQLRSGDVGHELMDVGPGAYDAILDRLETGVLPVVLRAPR